MSASPFTLGVGLDAGFSKEFADRSNLYSVPICNLRNLLPMFQPPILHTVILHFGREGVLCEQIAHQVLLQCSKLKSGEPASFILSRCGTPRVP
jgi:hypothetical protein